MDFLGAVCHDAQATLLGLFDPSVAPPLLFYSYIPIIIVSFIIGLYVFYKDKRSLKSRLLLSMTAFFVFWVLNILVQWVGAHNSIVMFGWQLTAVFEVGMFLSAIYFAQVFLYDRDVSFAEKLGFIAVSLAVLFFIPTVQNVAAYDLENCEGTNGFLWSVIYMLEPAVIVLIAWSGFNAYRTTRNRTVRRKNVLFTIGVVLFLSTFFLSNYYGELTKVYEFNLWGPVGMAVFLALLSYLIVQYNAFNAKLFATQALVWAIAFLIGARLFYSTTTAGTILSAVTLVGFLISGVFLVRSVKREISQREHIEKLAGELAQTNERQETLIHFIGHEVKGFLTRDMSAFAAISQGDFGAPPDGMKPFVDHALAESRVGVDSVSNILKASNLKKGTVTYTKEPVDLATLVAVAVQRAKPAADEKKISLNIMADPAGAPYMVTADKDNVSEHVLRNLIENAINYTPSGSVDIFLKKENGKVVFSVKDTGIGITEEDKKRLFTEGGHGRDSQRVNAHSTGYGLYIAKQIVEAHGGTIRAESEGEGKGSTFIVELPA